MVLRRESKVGKFDGATVVHDKNVLWLEVPMIDSPRVAVLDSRKNLQENISGLHVVADILALLGDLGKKVTFGAVLKHNICAVSTLQGLVEGHNVGMLALVVQLDLAILESPLTVVKTNLGQGFHGVLDVGQKISGAVDGAIRANTEHVCELNPIIQDQVDPVMRIA